MYICSFVIKRVCLNIVSVAESLKLSVSISVHAEQHTGAFRSRDVKRENKRETEMHLGSLYR